ncbi:hypothetical protein [Campylobacter mucosalis]|uniref:hypothetical protein n=1 Tax=Campylobacter mucosalis TaxID=202 RepID=UPI0014702F1F|nr:hypothetical protein [Campylobacter mucosalis]
MIDKKAIRDEILGLKSLDKDEFRANLATKMQKILNELIKANKDDLQNLSDAMSAINEALVGEKQRELYRLIDKADEIAKAINLKQNEIKSELKMSFETAEQVVQDSELLQKEYFLGLLNSAIMRETRLFDILKEISQNAFLTTLERGTNVEQTACEIAKSISFNTINDGEFSSERILEISKTIILSSIEVANESHAYAKELVSGAIMGSKEGISNAIEILKNNAKFAPSEIGIAKSIKELKNIDEGFISVLKEIGASSEEPSRSVIENLLDNSLDTGMAKLKRMSEVASATLFERLEEMKQNEKVDAFLSVATQRLEHLKSELSGKVDVNEKFESIKQEISEFEKKTNEKIEQLKHAQITKEAKKIGDRAYRAAKDFIANLKDKNEK